MFHLFSPTIFCTFQLPTGQGSSVLISKLCLHRDLDHPDWVLAEISTGQNTEVPAPRLLRARCSPSFSSAYDKILKLTTIPRWSHAPESSPSLPSAESRVVTMTIAVLGFILSSAAKHDAGSESLPSELQQLGLPKNKGNPWGGTVNQSWWDVADSSQPCLLHTQMEGRLAAMLFSITCLLYHQSLGAPQVLWWGLAGAGPV
ncbi:uncharacterized protein M8220_002025 [Acridotheres tristis]